MQQMRSNKMEELERNVSHLIFSAIPLFGLSEVTGDLRGTKMRSQKMEEQGRKVSRHLIFSILHLFALSEVNGDRRVSVDALPEDGRAAENGQYHIKFLMKSSLKVGYKNAQKVL